MIKFENVSKMKNDFLVLNGISFEIEDSTTTAFIGSKYSGKTELVKTFANFKNINEGHIDLGLNNENKQNTISIVFSDVEQNVNLTVYELFELYAKCQNIIIDKDDIDILLSKYKLLIYKNVNYDELSIYTKKIITIVKSLINNPNIWVLDSPMSIRNEETMLEIKDIIADNIGKRTIIFTSNNLDELIDLCDNIGVLHSGILLQFGDVESVFNKASISKKIEVVVEDVDYALTVLSTDKRIKDIVYDDNTITFTYIGDNNVQSDILKNLVNENIKIYSYKKDMSNLYDIERKIIENKSKIVLEKESF